MRGNTAGSAEGGTPIRRTAPHLCSSSCCAQLEAGQTLVTANKDKYPTPSAIKTRDPGQNLPPLKTLAA